MKRFAGATILLAVLTLSSCGRIEGDVIAGEGPGARAAGNTEVLVLAQPDSFYTRCARAMDALVLRPTAESAFRDSVLKANRAKPAGERIPDRTVIANIAAGYYGDPRASVQREIGRLWQALQNQVVWRGRTDLDGSFRSARLSSGEYLVSVDGTARRATVGAFGVTTVRIPYERWPSRTNCLSGDFGDDGS